MTTQFLSATIGLTLALLIPGSAIDAQTSQTPRTLQLDENARSAPAKLADLSWLAGHWSGEGLGAKADETWSMPAAGTMVGTFRLIENDKLKFSEFFVLMEEGDSLVLRLKHFDPLLNGWEAKDKFVEFKLVRIDGQTAYFDGLTYKLDVDGKLHAIVAMKQADGAVSEGEFLFQRVDAGKQSAQAPSAAEDEDRFPPIELPMDPDTVVLQYDQTGGFGIRPPPGFVRTPRLRIFANGKVVVGRANPNLGEATYQLDDRELMQLLKFVVNENQFYKITSDSLKRQIEATGRPIMIADAPSTELTVELVRGKHEVSGYALMMIANMYPEVEHLKKLDVIRSRLEELRSRACLGDKTQAQRIIKQLNLEFKRQYPGMGAFELTDLVSADYYADERITATFEREFVDEQGKAGNHFMAGVTKVGNRYEVSFREIPVENR
jgi:hypothetical protein